MNKIVGKLNENEEKEIRTLYEKKMALENLIKIVDTENHELYNKVMSDYTQVTGQFQNWWNVMSKKYNWERSENGHWTVNFDTYEVILVE